GKQIMKWIGELDAEQFKVRDHAFKELARVGRAAEPALRKELLRKPSLDRYRRIEELLQKMNDVSRPSDYLQSLRAVEVLVMVGTKEARKLLSELARGAPEAELTRHAKAALGRLTSKKQD